MWERMNYLRTSAKKWGPAILFSIYIYKQCRLKIVYRKSYVSVLSFLLNICCSSALFSRLLLSSSSSTSSHIIVIIIIIITIYFLFHSHLRHTHTHTSCNLFRFIFAYSYFPPIFSFLSHSFFPFSFFFPSSSPNTHTHITTSHHLSPTFIYCREKETQQHQHLLGMAIAIQLR